jgi:hypothetical protein
LLVSSLLACRAWEGSLVVVGGWSGFGLYSWAVGGGVGCCICRMVSEFLVGYIVLMSLRWFCDAASLWIGIYRHTKHR